MFEYFPDCYPWSMAVVSALGRGANISEIDRICRDLRPVAAAGDAAAIDAWVHAWSRAGYDRLDAAVAHRDQGHLATASELFLRASLYLAVAEGQAPWSLPGIEQIYRDSLEAFRDGIECGAAPVEFVSIPYGGGEMPALFVPAEGDAPPGGHRCVIHLNGLDSIKEGLYLRSGDYFAQRGFSSLFLDQPGSGEAIRFHGLPLVVEAGDYISPVVDHLAERADVDPDRIAVNGLSMGGYAAPRAAAGEDRLAACTVIGAFFDWVEIAMLSQAEGDDYAKSSSDLLNRLAWVAGDDDFISVFKDVTLRDAAAEITCPLLVVHGGRDRQIPVDHGEKTIVAATNSPRADLVVFDDHLGGEEHCSIDNIDRALAAVCDWLDEVIPDP